MKKILETSNYRLFNRSEENRPTNLQKHRKLLESMQLYGFLDVYPIIVFREKDGSLTVREGQHRLLIAESLGLPVFYVETVVDFDIAIVNCTQKAWVARDYAMKFAKNGKEDYQEGLDFADQNNLSIGTAFALLGGTATFANVTRVFQNGTFKVTDRKYAKAVANIYLPILRLSPELQNTRLCEACMAICRVDVFDEQRLLKCVAKCREKLINYSTKEAYLDMLEEVYNFGYSKLVPLKTLAIMAMRSRNAVLASKAKKAEKSAAKGVTPASTTA